MNPLLLFTGRVDIFGKSLKGGQDFPVKMGGIHIGG